MDQIMKGALEGMEGAVCKDLTFLNNLTVPC